MAETYEFGERCFRKKIEEEIVVFPEPEVAKGWFEVIAHGHIMERGSSARLGLANWCRQSPGREIVSGLNLHMTSRGNCVSV